MIGLRYMLMYQRKVHFEVGVFIVITGMVHVLLPKLLCGVLEKTVGGSASITHYIV